MRKLLTFTILGLFFGLATVQAHAQVMIEQGKVIIKASPGEVVVDSLTIHNTSDTNLTLRTYWEDFVYKPPFEGDKIFMAAGTDERSMSKWINFSPQQFSIEAHATRKISYSIQVPANARGGYCGVLFVENQGDKPNQNIGVTIVTRMGSLFFVDLTNSAYTGKISNKKYSDNNIEADFTNTGDVTLIPDTTFYILDENGLIKQRGAIKKFYLPSGKTSLFKVPLEPKLEAGKYTCVLTFDFGSGNNMTDEFEFIKSGDGKVNIGEENPQPAAL